MAASGGESGSSRGSGSPVGRSPVRQDGGVRTATALLGGLWGSDLQEVSDDPSVLDGSGRWAVVLPYDGSPSFLRFATWSTEPPAEARTGAEPWSAPLADWSSSMDESAYVAAVEATRSAIARGDVYQVNVCRVLSAPVPESVSVAALQALLAEGNPAPFGGFIDAPEVGIEIATASPELFLSREDGVLLSGPIKGTAASAELMLDKDAAENVMIVDLVRNDLARVCAPGTVEVPDLLSLEEHPGLVHLVSRVRGELRPDVGWTEILDATFPPGSVTGTPKLRALELIADLEPVSREAYCGAIGWVDADAGTACLAVAIRTFWIGDGELRFGTGAGITWSSDAQAEWQETELKAARLIGLANGGHA